MNKEFAVHMLNDDGKTKAAEIAQAFDDCGDFATVPEYRCGRCTGQRST